MLIILLVLLAIIVLGGLGFAAHFVWIIAGVLLVAWLLGFVLRNGASVGGRSNRWYRW